MDWDLGWQGLGVLGAIAVAFGVPAGWLVGRGVTRWLWASALISVACFLVGLVTSEVFFGWATEEELQPNIDGLSRDEVLLSSLLTTVLVVVVMRFLARARREGRRDAATGSRSAGARRPGRHA